MTEVVFQVIALLGFEDIVVFVFTLPAGSTGFDHLERGLVSEEMISDKGIMTQMLTGFTVGNDHLAPIEVEGFVTAAQGHFIDEAIGGDLGKATIPMMNWELINIPVSRQEIQPLVQHLMRLWQADDDKVELFLQSQFTQRYQRPQRGGAVKSD